MAVESIPRIAAGDAFFLTAVREGVPSVQKLISGAEARNCEFYVANVNVGAANGMQEMLQKYSSQS